MSERFVLPKLMPRERHIEHIARFLAGLSQADAWEVVVSKVKRRRSNQQNAYLWGVVYPTILKRGGEQLSGWTADDLHEYFLGEHFGWETLSGFGRKRMKPIRRSSKLSTLEFADYLAFIQRRCAELGIYIPDPNEQMAA
jgi:hypothetical protein